MCRFSVVNRFKHRAGNVKQLPTICIKSFRAREARAIKKKLRERVRAQSFDKNSIFFSARARPARARKKILRDHPSA